MEPWLLREALKVLETEGKVGRELVEELGMAQVVTNEWV